MSGRFKRKYGYALLTAIVAINIMAIMALMVRSMWETEYQREMELELLFRGKQIKTAIGAYMQKNNNLVPQSLEILYDKKFLRQLFKDPMTHDGKWNYVMRSVLGKDKNTLLVVPEEMLPQWVTQAQLIGVASTSPDEGFREYRGKKRYSEWAIYLGDDADKEMPEMKFIGEDEK